MRVNVVIIMLLRPGDTYGKQMSLDSSARTYNTKMNVSHLSPMTDRLDEATMGILTKHFDRTEHTCIEHYSTFNRKKNKDKRSVWNEKGREQCRVQGIKKEQLRRKMREKKGVNILIFI